MCEKTLLSINFTHLYCTLILYLMNDKTEKSNQFVEVDLNKQTRALAPENHLPLTLALNRVLLLFLIELCIDDRVIGL